MQQEPRARITWKKPESVQTFPVEVRTMEEVQLLLEMAPEVKTAGENTLDSSLLSLYNLLPGPSIGQTHPGAWEMEFSGISLEMQSSAGEEGLDEMELMETDPRLVQSTSFTVRHSFSPFHLHLTTSTWNTFLLQILSPSLWQELQIPSVIIFFLGPSSTGESQFSQSNLDVVSHSLVNSLWN